VSAPSIATLTIEQVEAGLATRQFSAVELAQSALQFAQAENPKTNAYLHFSPERALAAARRRTRNWRGLKMPDRGRRPSRFRTSSSPAASAPLAARACEITSAL